MKLGFVIELMLLKKQRKKVNPYLWHGLKHLKFCMSTLVSGFYDEPQHAVAVTKSSSVKMKLGIAIDFTLIKKWIKKKIHAYDVD